MQIAMVAALSFLYGIVENEHRNRQLPCNPLAESGSRVQEQKIQRISGKNRRKFGEVSHATLRKAERLDHRYISFDIHFQFEIIEIELRNILELLQCEKATKA